MQPINTPKGIVNFPDGMPASEIEAVLAAEFPPPIESDTPVTDNLSRLPGSVRHGGVPIETDMTWSDVGNAIPNNASDIGAVTGAVLGGAGGFASPVPGGTYLGSVGGAGVGSAIGETFEQWWRDEDIDLSSAAVNGLVDAGLEATGILAVKAAVKVAKPLAKKIGATFPEFMQMVDNILVKQAPDVPTPAAPAPPLAAAGAPPLAAAGVPPQVPQEGIVDDVLMPPGPAGSPESIIATQNLLTPEGGTLSMSQAGVSNKATAAAEGLSNAAIIARDTGEKRAQKNANIIGGKIETLMGDIEPNPSASVGQQVHTIIKEGKKAISVLYDDALKEVAETTSNRVINTSPIRGTLKSFRAKGQEVKPKYTIDPKTGKPKMTHPGWSSYQDDTIALLDEWDEALNTKTMTVDNMLAFQKKLNAQIREMGDFGNTKSNQAARELADLSKTIRAQTVEMLEKIDPKAAEQYLAANKAYGEDMNLLLPDLNANVIRAADKGDFHQMGKKLIGQNADQIDGFMKSIDKSFEQIDKAGMLPPDGTGVANLPSAEVTKDLIRGSYMREMFGDLTGDFDMGTFARKSMQFDKPRNRAQALAVLGPKKYGQFKRLLNAMTDNSHEPNFMGTLVLRSKEAGTIKDVANIATGAAVVSGVASAGVTLFAPVLMAKYVNSPARVTRLLAGTKNLERIAKKNGTGSAVFARAVDELSKQMFGDLTPHEQADVKEQLIENPTGE